MSRYEEYRDLLTKNYDEVIALLQKKYGPAEDDYFREKSYQRFLDGEIKRPTKGKYTRTNEGLYCHHIDEIKELNIADPSFIRENNIPFKYQKRERLVFCDLIEHAILHVLVAKETTLEFGLPGYEVYLKRMIEEWYIEEKMPKPLWMQNCYHKAFLFPEQAVCIIKEMESTLGFSYISTPQEYFERRKEQHEQIIKQREENRKKLEEEEKKNAKEREEREELEYRKKLAEFYQNYPEFEEMEIRFDSSRRQVVALLFEHKYSDRYKGPEELDLAKRNIIKDKLIEELYTIISELPECER